MAGAAFSFAALPAQVRPASCRAELANPLLDPCYFPRFADIQPDHVTEGMEARLAEASLKLEELERRVEAMLAAKNTPGYQFLADSLEEITESYEGPWSTVCHLKQVKDTPELRAAHAAIEPKIVEFETRVGQSAAVYRGWKAIKADEAVWSQLAPEQRRVADLEVLRAELKGIGLAGDDKERFGEIETELASLSTSFSNHVLDATKAFARKLTRPDQVRGLPKSALQMMAAAARARGDAQASAEEGPWVVTLDAPSLIAVLRYADDADLREAVYRAYVTRASAASTSPPAGGKEAVDNEPVINRILALRAERAKLLGYPSHAHVSLAEKMASLEGAKGLLEDLRTKCFDRAAAEHAELEKFAGRTLRHWDVAYYAEKLKEERYAFDDEMVRPYLSLDAVFDGLWRQVETLFGVTAHAVEPAAVGAQVWDPEVRLFELRRGEEPVAYCFVDPYARSGEKRGGAWMSEVRSRSRLCAPPGQAVRLPAAQIVCNQGPPVRHPDGTVTPSLMTIGEVRTLFHECGHALQHMLTRVDEGHVSGIRGVEWDAVEQPSQWMEYWMEQPATIKRMAKHHETGEPMPEDLIKKIRAAKNYRAASDTLRQLKFALTDLALHEQPPPGASGAPTIWETDRAVSKRTSVLPPLSEDRFLCAFSHLFASGTGGYSAGYYSYKWAEVLSADGFAVFEEAGLENEAEVKRLGRRYAETVLGMGGSRPAAEIFKLFRGREPSVDALLRHNDLVTSAAA